MSAIFRFPAGLQDFLATKATGVNPNVLDERVSPSIELADFYLAAVPSTLSSITGVFAATGSAVNNAVVPAGEIWVLDWCSVVVTDDVNIGFGNAFIADESGNIIWRSPSSGVLGSGIATYAGLGVRTHSSMQFEHLTIIPAGWAIGCESSMNGSGPTRYQSKWSYRRFLV